MTSIRNKTFAATLLAITISLALPNAHAANGFLYALNDVPAAANHTVGFTVNEQTGALTPIAGSPFATGGNGDAHTTSERLVVDRHNQRLYAINGGSNTLSAFAIDTGTGVLTALPFSPIALGAGIWSTVAVHPSGSPVVVGSAGGGLASFVITSTTATAATGSPFSTGAAFPFSASFSQDGAFVYTGGSSGSVFAGFSVNATTGVLTALAGSPFDSGANPVAYAADASGRLFTASIGSGQLRVFITAAGIPTAVAGNPFTSGLTTAVQGILHPNGYYMVADRNNDAVGVYKIAGSGAATTLAAVPGSPFDSGDTFTDALALNQSGTFLYAVNGTARDLTTFTVNAATGALTSLSTQAANTLGSTGNVTGMAYLHAANILVFTEPGVVADASTPLVTALQNLGNSVTTADPTTFPADLSSFDTIWGAQFQTSLNAGQMAVLALFVQSGKGLFLTGERGGLLSTNASDLALINALVAGGAVGGGADADAGPPYSFNSTAVGRVTTTPNAIASILIQLSSVLTGVSGNNVLISDKSNHPVGAIWGPSSMVNRRGKLAIIMDVNWYSDNINTPDALSTVQNIEAFLEGGDVSVKISAPPSALPLSNLTYTVTVTNTAPVNMPNVSLTDALPAGATFVSANFPQGTTSFAAGTVTANLGTINAASSVTGTIVIQPIAGTVSNTVSIATSTRDIDAGNDSATATTLVIDNPPAFTSAPTALPNPAGLGQTIQFTAVAADPDAGQTLSFTWNFGDGASGSGATPTHAYIAPGTYIVMAIVSDGTLTATTSVSVTVNAALIGTGPDSDGDGFSDTFESLPFVATDPKSAASTPTGAPVTIASIQKLSLVKPTIKLNFAKANSDSIGFSGVVIVPDGFNPNGAKVVIDVSGVTKGFTLTNGGAKTAGDSLKFSIKSAKGVVALQTAKFTAKFQKSSFATALAAAGLTNATISAKPVVVIFTMIFNNTVLQKIQTMSYTAKLGKSGAAK